MSRPGQYRSYRNKVLFILLIVCSGTGVLGGIFFNHNSLNINILITIGLSLFIYTVLAGMFLMAQFICKIGSVFWILRVLRAIRLGESEANIWGLTLLFNLNMPIHPEILEHPSVMYLLGFLLRDAGMSGEAEIFLSQANLDEEFSSRTDPFQYLISSIEDITCYRLYRRIK